MQINPNSITSSPQKIDKPQPLTMEQITKDLELMDLITSGEIDRAVQIDEYNSRFKLPGMKTKLITINTSSGVNCNIKLYTAQNIDDQTVKNIETKLTNALKNMPENVLDDFAKECRTLVLLDEISIEKRAYALAMGPLDQIFLSASKMENLSDEGFETTIVHELGHLIDNYYQIMHGAQGIQSTVASIIYQRDFDKLKKMMSEELGFDTSSHTLDNVKEFYADAYLDSNYDLPQSHRAKNIFDLLKKYDNDVKNLTLEELEEKYEQNTEKIKELVNQYDKLKSGFNYYRGNIDADDQYLRIDKHEPMTLEQIIESNLKNK